MHTAKKALIAMAVLLFCGVALVPRARADEWDQSVKLTFNQPVDIPGRALPAGTYWFKLYNSGADRNVVEIYGPHREHLYAIEQTDPALRPVATDRVEVQFAERPHDQPEALLTWYYPGMLYGHQFIYSPHAEKFLAQDERQELLVSPRGSISLPPSTEAVG